MLNTHLGDPRIPQEQLASLIFRLNACKEQSKTRIWALRQKQQEVERLQAELEATTQKLAEASGRNGKIRRVIKQRYAAIQFVHREATLANAASDGDAAAVGLGHLC